MSRFTRFSADEIERRRIASVAGLKARDRSEFDRRYQEACDAEYWGHGQCCAGCDHWRSDMGLSGQCAAAIQLRRDAPLRDIPPFFMFKPCHW